MVATNGFSKRRGGRNKGRDNSLPWPRDRAVAAPPSCLYAGVSACGGASVKPAELPCTLWQLLVNEFQQTDVLGQGEVTPQIILKASYFDQPTTLALQPKSSYIRPGNLKTPSGGRSNECDKSQGCTGES